MTSDATNALLGTVEAMANIVSMVAGYRAQLEEQGFSPTASEIMAADYHRALLGKQFEVKK